MKVILSVVVFQSHLFCRTGDGLSENIIVLRSVPAK